MASQLVECVSCLLGEHYSWGYMLCGSYDAITPCDLLNSCERIAAILGLVQLIVFCCVVATLMLSQLNVVLFVLGLL